MQVTDAISLGRGPKQILGAAGSFTKQSNNGSIVVALEDSVLTTVVLTFDPIAYYSSVTLLAGHQLLGVESATINSGRVIVYHPR